MPSRYTSQMSKDDAALQAAWLPTSNTAKSPSKACSRPPWRRWKERFAPAGAGHGGGKHPIALPRRALMGISNKNGGAWLLTTGNKSETVGYATLYGDMAGALRPQGLQHSCWCTAMRLAQCTIAGHSAAGDRAAALAELRHARRTTTACRRTRSWTPSSKRSSRGIFRWIRFRPGGFDRKTVGRILDLVKQERVQETSGRPLACA